VIVRAKNFALKSEEITKEKVSMLPKNDTEKKALQIIYDWNTGMANFHFNTSGSTGKSRKISISREQIVYSTEATFAYIAPADTIRSSLLCIDPGFIGGAMVVFRAIIKALDLFITEPSLNPIASVPGGENFDLVSMVPLQLEKLSKKDLSRVSIILVGGASFNDESLDLPANTRVFSTYGMTETVSHIALRKTGDPVFHTTGDTTVKTDANGCLSIKGSITQNNWLKTNDLARVLSPHEFELIGRKDFIINSGGIKINPEEIEKKLSKQIRYPFVVSSKPDKRLGEKLVLIVATANEKPDFDFSFLHKYEKPKEVIYWDKVIKTKSGKIDRHAIRKLLHSHSP